MLLNHPIDYLHFVCVCVCDGLRGGAKRYMLMGPCVGKADSSFIRLYYTKQYTVTRAHTCTHTHKLYAAQIHHTKQRSREQESKSVLEDGVCLYRAYTLDGAG